MCRITCRIYKRQSSIEEVPIRDEDKEKVGIHDEEDICTPLTFWHASDNAGEATDLAEPATFQDAINGTKQVHLIKAIREEELESMRLRGIFRSAKLPSS